MPVRVAIIQGAPHVTAVGDATALAAATTLALAGGAELVLPAVDGSWAALGRLGRLAVLRGDAAIDPAMHAVMAADAPDVLLLLPASESELQAEATIEVALGLSLSLAGLVIVTDTAGSEPGVAGHGGSAIILLGEVAAEALLDEEVLVADIPVPIPAPEPRAPLPVVPPILLQRLAHHRGGKVAVDYPADLS